MVFEFSRKILWQKVEELHPSPSPQDPQKCRDQLGEAFYLILEIEKENIPPDVVVKIDSSRIELAFFNNVNKTQNA